MLQVVPALFYSFMFKLEFWKWAYFQGLKRIFVIPAIIKYNIS